MFIAVGAGAYAFGVFHLTTHAFFKACLFLGAGSVMHAMHGELDIYKMGNLRRKLPLTWLTMLAATLAIAGVPFSAGFASKDGILLAAYEAGGGLVRAAFILGLLTAGLTSFYMFRLFLLTFHGEPRDRELHEQAHEAPWAMAGVLCVLGVLSLVGHIPFNVPRYLTGHEPHHAGIGFTAVVVGVGLMGFVAAFMLYGRVNAGWVEKATASPARGLRLWIERKWFVDAVYDWAFVRSTIAASRFLWRWIDDGLIDGMVNVLGLGMQVFGEFLRMFQTGLTRNYALFVFLGSLGVLFYLVL